MHNEKGGAENLAATRSRKPRASKTPFTTEAGWAFEARLNAMATDHPWLNEDLLPASSQKAAQVRRRFDLAKQVEPLRRSLHLTQAQAAQRMGVARTTVVAIEKGTRGVTHAELAALRGDPERAGVAEVPS